MNKILIILLFFILGTSAFAHSTKNINIDMRAECKKSKSVLNWVSKNRLTNAYYIRNFSHCIATI